MRRRTVLPILGTVISIVGLGAVLTVAQGSTPVGPSYAEVRAAYQPSDVRLLDRFGAVIHEVRIDTTRRRLAWTELADVSPALPLAVLASEDRRFSLHHGVDGRALLAATVQRFLGRGSRGASTLTMQLATVLGPAAGVSSMDRSPLRGASGQDWSLGAAKSDNLLDLRRHGGPRTLAQKWRQMKAAWAIERHWSKAEILEAYLNLVTFRGELQGVAAAASVLFGKAPHGITEPEALVLAALVRSPNAGQEAVTRRVVRLRDAEQGTSTRPEIEAAVAQALSAPPGTGPRVALAPHAAHRLLGSSINAGGPSIRPLERWGLLGTNGEMLGKLSSEPFALRTQPVRHWCVSPRNPTGWKPVPLVAPASSRWRFVGSSRLPLAAYRRAFQQGNRQSLLAGADPSTPRRSTLDAGLQQVAAESLRRNLLAVRARRVQDGAVLVADNASGDVLAYVGGSSDLSSARYVDGIQARRQAGSALKPFLYGLAFDRRLLTPASLIEDTPLELAVAGGLYRPQNYDEVFRGLVSARTALSASLNVPAVRTLGVVGGDAFVQQLRRLGFDGLVESGDYYGPALALGAADVSLWEMVTAYRTLANGGRWSPLRLTPTERSGDGDVRLYSAAAAFLVSHVLADRESRSITFGLENPLVTRFWTAVKTGTSKDMRDNWCIGYSRRYTVGVWVGNFSGEPMQDVSGVTGAAPIWLEVMEWLHRETPSVAPPAPGGVLTAAVAYPRDLEPPRDEWFLDGTEPAQPRAALVVDRPRILSPVSGTIIALDPDIPMASQRILFEAQERPARAHWVLDRVPVGMAAAPVMWEPQPGSHTLSLVDARDRTVDSVRFVVRGSRRVGSD